MVTANEIKVGNIFIREKGTARGLEYDHNFKVDEYWMGKLFGESISLALQDLSPIPLDEDVLIKCGFAKADDGYGGYLSPNFNGGSIRIKENRWHNGCWDTEVKYLHQLQNLYYALTNQEINIRL